MDGDQQEEHRWYRYGGMWKNKHEAVSAKKPKGIGKKAVVDKGNEDVDSSMAQHATFDEE